MWYKASHIRSQSVVMSQYISGAQPEVVDAVRVPLSVTLTQPAHPLSCAVRGVVLNEQEEVSGEEDDGCVHEIDERLQAVPHIEKQRGEDDRVLPCRGSLAIMSISTREVIVQRPSMYISHWLY